MKKLPSVLLYTGLAIAVLGIAVFAAAPWIMAPGGKNFNLVIYPAVILPALGALVLLAQLGLLIAKKYQGRLKFVLPQMILLGAFLLYSLPGALQGGDIFLPAPKNAAEAAKLFNDCGIAHMRMYDWEDGSKNMLMQFESGRMATMDNKLWPEFRDEAMKNTGNCGYELQSSTESDYQAVVRTGPAR